MLEFFKSPVVRSILAFTALTLVSLVIWFVGPLLSFNELRPLASIIVRVTFIVLMLMLVIFWLLEWNLSAIGVTALCLLVWHASPLVAFAGVRPFELVWARVVVISLIVLIFAIWAIYVLWNLIRNDEAFAKKLFDRNKNKPQALAKEDIRAIGEKARNAISQLKQMHLSVAGGTGSVIAGLRRLLEGKRYLYELPWYVLIGNSGAGKTSMLMNSGLKFPVADQMGIASAHLTLSQDTGTQNCTWWFTNDAVLVDTAGRYTTSDIFQKNTIKVTTANVDEANAEAGMTNAMPKSVAMVEVAKEEFNHAEWLGFLGVLRQVRSRAPINGALLTIDVSELLSTDASQLLIQAAQLRHRLEELRQHLGIRFPVYVMLTKTDRLRGFVDYFSSLTSEGRAQVWGFTLPWLHDNKSLTGKRAKSNKLSQRATATMAVSDAAGSDQESSTQADWPLARQISHEMNALQQRISDGVAIRLQEEFDEDRRQSLYLLPHELKALVPALAQLLEAVFVDSRYDTTQMRHALRGVYFTSAMQYDDLNATADKSSVIARLHAEVNKIKKLMCGRPGNMPSAPISTRSYFVTDALIKVIFPEANLVKPNMRWEARYRLLRLLGHSIVLLVFFGMASGLLLSHKNNQNYLNEVATKTKSLTIEVSRMYGNLKNSEVTAVLGSAQTLPTLVGLDLNDPPSSYQFGLYTGEAIQQGAEVAYGQLQDRVILPVIIERMEYVMRTAVRDNDTQKAATTLRAYLLLHDLKKFNETPSAAKELHNWVLHDWQSGDKKTSDLVSDQNIDQGIDTSKEKLLSVMLAELPPPNLSLSFDNSAAMISYLNDMFSGRRVVQADTGINVSLVREVRGFLDSRLSSQRLYDRAKAAMMNDVPQDFTLVRALGPQAGTLFARASGNSLEKGVPGIFTYEGYHDVFSQRLPELIQIAFLDDRWLMGTNGKTQTKGTLKNDDGSAEIIAVAEDIRRQYLREYAQYWTEFLEDLRVVQSNSAGGTLSFELDVLRRLAAADSPLVKLSRILVRQTTLSRNLNTNANEKSFMDKATNQLEKKIPQTIMRPEQRMERELVDDRFAALREVVIGQGDNGLPSVNAKPELEVISSLLNEYYTVLVVADTALAANNLPPSGVDVANKIKIEAGKLPAPFHAILLGVGDSGASKVELGAAAILRNQAQSQMDRLVGLMALYVSEPCRRGIAGRYPFADSTQDASIDDFNSIFAAGSPADEFFKKSLAPLVDTSTRPWRYKSPDSVNLMATSDALTNGQASVSAATGPTLTGELLKLLAKSGPNPEIFNQMAQIRQVFFREHEAKRMALKFLATVQSLDPSVTEVILDFDGQVQRYSHGPVQPFQISWPGPRGGIMAEVSVQPRLRPDTSTISSRGPWALLRLLERGKVTQGANAGRVEVEFEFDGRRMNISLDTGAVNPLTGNFLKGFSCPTT
ncbi:type VI secretion system membrane subunit TssM [Undibacterium sp. RuRC25W]|uniref:type VI secretion system membrane subunit TssM n=1 Tax=Undibacterium sp. RuRC25W TaxID=3413047 RepID=UPI003BF2CA75